MDFIKNLKVTTAGLFLTCSAMTWAEAPANYYTSCENKGGKTLLSSLHDVMGAHTNVGYDGLWEVYETSDVRTNGKVWDMYSTKEWTVGQERCGNYKYVGDCINREHSFPKSWFGDGSPMVSDAFHIYPTDGKVNGQRSNYAYGECANGTTLPSNGNVKALGKLGTCTFPGYTGKVFEPDDEYKGDFARSYFYMAACYYDKIAGWSSDMLAGNNFPAFKSWAVDLLLKWHRQDPVSEKETRRNDAVYAYQRNRNPFIDHPEMVEYIWGEKATQTWTSSGVSEPMINQPVSGSTIDLGLTAKNVSISRAVTVKTTNATGNVSVSMSGTGFSVSSSSIAATSTNSQNGAAVTVSFVNATEGSAAGTLTVSAGDVKSTVTVKADVVDGLPAGPAREISDESFLAVWTYIGDEDASGNYTLAVSDANGDLPGYPRQVNAKAGNFLVEGLQAMTEYTYTVSSRSLVSKPVSVTTAEPFPSIDFLFDGTLDFSTMPGVASEIAEILIETDNVEGDYTVSVDSPFQLSTDKNYWNNEIILSPDEDRMYMRLYATTEGSYSTSITAVYGDFVSDDATATGTVAATASYVEDFETTETGSYTTTDVTGDMGLWIFNDAGIWNNSSDPVYMGNHSVRFGKTTSSSIAMGHDKPHGAGELRFFARVWRNDGDAKLDVLVSTDGGANFTKAGSLDIVGEEFKEYSMSLLSTGNVRIMLQQTEGKRMLVDFLTISDYASGLEFPDADYHTWDAYSLNGELIVETAAATGIAIYGIDGITYFNDRIPKGTHSFTLPAGQLYIVVSGDFSRRVLMK